MHAAKNACGCCLTCRLHHGALAEAYFHPFQLERSIIDQQVFDWWQTHKVVLVKWVLTTKVMAGCRVRVQAEDTTG